MPLTLPPDADPRLLTAMMIAKHQSDVPNDWPIQLTYWLGEQTRAAFLASQSFVRPVSGLKPGDPFFHWRSYLNPSLMVTDRDAFAKWCIARALIPNR